MVQCVRWYLAYSLSLRNLEEMMAERGVGVDHSTLYRWIIRLSTGSAGARTLADILTREGLALRRYRASKFKPR